MDMQKSAANRVRHILQAMERSIDSARSRRTNVPSAAAAQTTQQGATHRTTSANHGSFDSPLSRTIGSAQPHTQRMPQHAAMHGHAPQGAVNHTPASNRPVATPADPSRPQRLKAKPKRFEGNFASQFAQNAQQSYRAQTG